MRRSLVRICEEFTPYRQPFQNWDKWRVSFAVYSWLKNQQDQPIATFVQIYDTFICFFGWGKQVCNSDVPLLKIANLRNYCFSIWGFSGKGLSEQVLSNIPCSSVGNALSSRWRDILRVRWNILCFVVSCICEICACWKPGCPQKWENPWERGIS